MNLGPFKAVRLPINTQAKAKKDPSMRGWVMGGNPNAIEAQEAEGQQSFVNSDTLPTKRNDYGGVNSQKVLEAAGVKFGIVIPDDSLFQYVELPQGWKKVPTSHSMWSDLVDEKGRKRASIFYKAAFYDRDTFYSVDCRYRVEFDYDREEKEGVGISHVKDGNAIVFTTEPIKVASGEKSYEFSKRSNQAAFQWLDETLPKWRDPGAYWD